ncbi:hypothetical protein HN011_004999 [Eciton burchellii]|nr:hypothetical protein HN011_004999 [Eciton burchellii]
MFRINLTYRDLLISYLCKYVYQRDGFVCVHHRQDPMKFAAGRYSYPIVHPSESTVLEITGEH